MTDYISVEKNDDLSIGSHIFHYSAKNRSATLKITLSEYNPLLSIILQLNTDKHLIRSCSNLVAVMGT